MCISCMLLVGFFQGKLFPIDHAVKVKSVLVGEYYMSINVPKNTVNWNDCGSCSLRCMGHC